MKTTKKIAMLAMCLLTAGLPLQASMIGELVTVGDIGNAANSDGYGAVAYTYDIGKYEVTVTQYVDFLNEAAKSDPNGLYHTSMSTWIQRSGASGNYSYTAKPGFESFPIGLVTFTDAARFVNWLTTNGESTEYGSYDLRLDYASTDNYVRMDAAEGMTHQYFVVSEDEWYKAAYYDPTLNDGQGGYWDYGTRSNTAPTAAAPSGTPNTANFGGLNGLLPVGAYTGTSTYYGLYDMVGNAGEITDSQYRLTGTTLTRVRRGATSGNSEIAQDWRATATEATGIGFRIVMVPAQIPEPGSVALMIAGAAGVMVYGKRMRQMKGGQ